VATLLRAKAGRLPSGVSGREPSANRRSKQSRTVGEVAMTSAGAACATEIISVAGPCRSNAQVDPKANGATALRKGYRRTAEPGRFVLRRSVV
jgi:hypothetical protein